MARVRPYAAVLGRVDKVKGYHDVVLHPRVHCIPGLVLPSCDAASLLFGNACSLREGGTD